MSDIIERIDDHFRIGHFDMAKYDALMHDARRMILALRQQLDGAAKELEKVDTVWLHEAAEMLMEAPYPDRSDAMMHVSAAIDAARAHLKRENRNGRPGKNERCRT